MGNEKSRRQTMNRKGSTLLRSTQTATYNDKVHTGVWAQSRESFPKDYDVTATDSKTRDMHKSTYDHFSNIQSDYRTSYQIQNQSLEHFQPALKSMPEFIHSVLKTNMLSHTDGQQNSPKWRTIYKSDYLTSVDVKPFEPHFAVHDKDFKIKFSYFYDGFSAKRHGMHKFADCDGF